MLSFLLQTFKFMSIRVDNPVVLVVNKKKLGANRLAPSTLLVTTKSEWSPGVVVGGNTPDIRQAHWFAVFLRLLDKLIDWCDTKMGKTFIYGRKDLAPLGSLKLSAPSAQVAMSLIPRCNLKTLFLICSFSWSLK